jgi:predicted phage gp36 major capsid-like protein
VGKRSRNRKTVATSDYVDDDGNVLTLRQSDAKVPDGGGGAAATAEDRARRVAEMRFERYVARWEIAGLPLTKQKELLARYRMADRATQDWVQRTIDRHLESA